VSASKLARFNHRLAQPLSGKSRIGLLVASFALLLSFSAPLWHINLQAPQYPKGLNLWIHSWKVVGGNEGHDIVEINNLNHYIGMRSLDRESLVDLNWLPFAFGGLVLLTLRCAAIGDVRTLVDLVVMVAYFSLFAFGRFIYQLYDFGHNLDPKAPMNIKPFMPPMLGSKQIANFTSSSYPGLGSVFMGLFVFGVVAILADSFWRPLQEAEGEASAEVQPSAAPLS
tara:strand:- start:1068 stop:1745 length:678 start_codon:yes stop_codon:yes gene_type:complete